MGFEVYTRPTYREPYVLVSGDRVTPNKEARRLFAELPHADSWRVELLFDHETRRAAIRPVVDYGVVMNRGNGLISVAGFCARYSIDSAAVRYPAAIEDGMLVFGPLEEKR